MRLNAGVRLAPLGRERRSVASVSVFAAQQVSRTERVNERLLVEKRRFVPIEAHCREGSAAASIGIAA